MLDRIKYIVQKHYGDQLEVLEADNNVFLYSAEEDIIDQKLSAVNNELKKLNLYFDKSNVRMALLKNSDPILI